MQNNVFGNHPETDTTSKGLVPIGGNNLTTALVAASAANPRSLTGWVGSKLSNLLMQDAVAEAHHEQLRALLTKAAMDNVAALATLEAHLREVAPLGEARYKTLLDAHALATALRLARW